MTSDNQQSRKIHNETVDKIRNPYGVMDVPDPFDRQVEEFAATVILDGAANDENASVWFRGTKQEMDDTIEGQWCSRWSGGPDPTIPNDTKEKWKPGRGEAKLVGDRIYFLFDWDNGARRGLIEARRTEPDRLIGKYINLTSPEIKVPWVGIVVNDQRIDGRHAGGRLDFRR